MQNLSPKLRASVLAAFASVASSGGLHASTITWTNAGTDWATPGNWSGTTTPPTNDLTTDIASFGSTTQVPTWSAARSVGGLSFTAAATYSIGSSGTNNTLSVGSSGMNFGNNAVTLNINNSSFNQNLYLGGTGTLNSGVTTGTGAVTIRATTTASQYLLTIMAGGTATFDIGSGGLTMGGNSGSGSTRQAIAFGSGTSTLLKTGSGTMTFASSSTNGAPGLPNGIYDIRQGTLSSDVNNGNFFGTSTITLGDTTGSASSTLQIQRVGTFNNALTVRSGSSGTKTFAVNNQAQTTSGTITLNDNLTFQLRANGGTAIDVTQSGAISGGGNLTFNSSNNTAGVTTGNLTLGVANASWNGALTIGNAASDTSKVANLVIGNTAALSASNNVTVSNQGTLRLNGNNLTIGYLAGGGTSSFVENNHATTDSTLTITTSSGDISFGGVVRNGAAAKLNVVKAGAGTQRLTNANTFTGNVSVTGGTLIIQNASGLGASNNVDAGASGTFKTAIGSNTLNVGALTGSGTVTGSLGGSVNSVLAVNVASGSSTFSGNITQEFSGTFGITKLGGGTQVLSGTNTHTGPTMLGNGVLSVGTIGNGGVAGNLGAAGVAATNLIFDGGTLQYTGANASSNRAFTINSGKTATIDTANDIAFAGATGPATNGALTKNGTGTLSLNGINTYTGLSTVNDGTLLIANSLPSGNALALGANGKGVFQNAGQTLGAVSNANTAANALNFTASTGTVTLASLSGAGNTRFGSAGTVTGGISSGTVNAVGLLTADISGGTVGAGSLSATTVNGGTSTITGAAAITTVSGGSTTVGGIATIGTMSAGSATLNGATSSISTLNGGSINLGNTTLTVNSGSTSSSITGASGSLVKETGGTLTLSGANSYGGGTTVNGGSLFINSSTGAGSGAITVNSGVLKVNASIGNVINLNGGTLSGNATLAVDLGLNSLTDTISPGNSPGIASFSTTQNWSSYTYEWEINNFTGNTAGTDFDQIAITTGGLNLGGSYVLDVLSLDNLNASGAVPNFSENSISWTIISTQAGITGFNAGQWTINDATFKSINSATGNFALALTNSGNDLSLVYTPIPEPSAYAAIAGVGAIGLALYRRRKARG